MVKSPSLSLITVEGADGAIITLTDAEARVIPRFAANLDEGVGKIQALFLSPDTLTLVATYCRLCNVEPIVDGASVPSWFESFSAVEVRAQQLLHRMMIQGNPRPIDRLNEAPLHATHPLTHLPATRSFTSADACPRPLFLECVCGTVIHKNDGVGQPFCPISLTLVEPPTNHIHAPSHMLIHSPLPFPGVIIWCKL